MRSSSDRRCMTPTTLSFLRIKPHANFFLGFANRRLSDRFIAVQMAGDNAEITILKTSIKPSYHEHFSFPNEEDVGSDGKFCAHCNLLNDRLSSTDKY